MAWGTLVAGVGGAGAGTAAEPAWPRAGSAVAEIRLPRVFSDHMVLQCDVPVRVWGWADPGAEIRVDFAGQVKRATADRQGRWRVELDPMGASAQPRELRVGAVAVAAPAQERLVRDVLVGEVWLASGQSNVDMLVKSAHDPERETATADLPQIRVFQAAQTIAVQPARDLKGGTWKVCTTASAPNLSALGFFFARELHLRLRVPAGIVQCSWGNTPAESWMSRETLLALPETREPFSAWLDAVRAVPDGEAKFEDHHREWVHLYQAQAKGGPPAPKTFAKQAPTGAYNAMIAPLTAMRFRGAIWYQGETNGNNDPRPYGAILRALIQSWRRTWDVGDFPFLFVQLANHHGRRTDPVEEPWAELREGQRLALAEPNTAMTVAIDLGGDGIHPKNKQEVGRRLALAAQALAYGEPIEYSGPLYAAMASEGAAIRVSFTHAQGLRARGGRPLVGFAIAGADRRFVWAEARIEMATVVVSSPQVPAPVAVRYAFASNPACNLENAAGLPASPFRTDGWPLRASAKTAKP
jgi:sialate O-acetylesterase